MKAALSRVLFSLPHRWEEWTIIEPLSWPCLGMRGGGARSGIPLKRNPDSGCCVPHPSEWLRFANPILRTGWLRFVIGPPARIAPIAFLSSIHLRPPAVGLWASRQETDSPPSST